MFGVLTLSIPNTPFVYYQIVDADGYPDTISYVITSLRMNLFKNTHLQEVFNISPLKVLDSSFIYLGDEKNCKYHIADILKKKLLSDRDIREICNVGDLLDVPGLVRYNDVCVNTTSVYKYIHDNGLYQISIKAFFHENTDITSKAEWV